MILKGQVQTQYDSGAVMDLNTYRAIRLFLIQHPAVIDRFKSVIDSLQLQIKEERVLLESQKQITIRESMLRHQAEKTIKVHLDTIATLQRKTLWDKIWGSPWGKILIPSAAFYVGTQIGR